MKSHKLISTILLAMAVLFMFGCHERDDHPMDPGDNYMNKMQQSIAVDMLHHVRHFDVVLLDGYPMANNGNYEWRWMIYSRNTSYPDLIAWGMSLGECAGIDNVVSAAYSTDGENWTEFTPEYNLNENTEYCNDDIGNTLFFDQGTTGDDTVYYRLILNEDFDVDRDAQIVIRFGNTCCVDNFAGIGCEDVPQEEECFSEEELTGAGNRTFTTGFPYIRYAMTGTNTPVTYDLKDEDDNIVGDVSVSDVGGMIHVTFNTDEGWFLVSTLLDYACSTSGTNGLHVYGGYPQWNNFDITTEHNPYVQTYQYTFAYPDCGTCNIVYIMAYAYVVEEIPC